MKSARLFLSFVLVGLLCVAAQAEIVPGGFQGVFGDVEASPFTFTEGVTSGDTSDAGITASIYDLEVGLSGFVANGDAVSIDDLVLEGFDDCSGKATYSWDFAELYQYVASPQFALGAVMGTLTLQSNNLAIISTSELITLPQNIAATLTYNGATVASDGSATTLTFPSASITATASVPEPSTMVCLLAGLCTLLIWRRK